jgi:hypothetical protein
MAVYHNFGAQLLGSVSVTTYGAAGATVATATELAGGILVCSNAGAQTIRMPIATDIIAQLNCPVNQVLGTFSVIDTLGGGVTIDVAGLPSTGVTLVGNVVLAANTSGTFAIVRTGAATVSIFRVA